MKGTCERRQALERIVHGYIHCVNILIRPGEGQKGEVIAQNEDDEDNGMRTLSSESDDVSLYLNLV
jgi:hypothetical protein